jgi:hypothetical protein
MNPGEKSVQVPYYVRGLTMGLPAITFGLTLQSWLHLPALIRTGFIDFRHLYTAGFMIRTGQAAQLYDPAAQRCWQTRLVGPLPHLLPFNHPAYEALLWVPLSFLDFRSAFLAFFVLNLVLLTICFWVLRPYMNQLAGVWRWAPLAVFVGYVPLAAALMQGQDSIMLLMLMTLAWISLEHSEFRSGLLLGLGIFKFHLVLPIAALLFFWRRMRFVLGFALSSCAALLLSFGITGTAALKDYVLILQTMNRAEFHVFEPQWMPNLRGLLAMLLRNHVAHLSLWIVLSSLILFMLVLLRSPQTLHDGFLIGIVLTTLIAYHVLPHDMSILLLPIAIALNKWIIEPDWRLVTASVAFAAMALVAISREAFPVASLTILAFLAALSESSPPALKTVAVAPS